MLSSAAQTVRNLGRYRQIVQVLVKYGFREIIAQLRLDSLPGLGGGRVEPGEATGSADESAHGTARRVRLAMVELGPPFIKLGQILSVRADLVPPAYQQEFQKLQHEVPPFPFAEAKAIVEGELGASLTELFATFEPEPVAAASIAQVHRATLSSGETVAVKIQRPGIRRQLETDIRILYDLAGLVERYLPEQTDLVDPTAAVDEFARMVRQELDFEEEGRHMTRFNELFASWPEVQAPTVHPALTAGRVLTMSFLDGIPLGQVERLEAAGHDRLKLAERVVEIGVREVFGFGFFHADPHPGNLLALSGPAKNRIGLLDFGIVGRIDDELRDAIARLLMALTTGDDRAATDVLIGLSPDAPGAAEIDEVALQRDIRAVLDRYRGKQRSEIDLSALLGQMMELIRRYRLRVPSDMILMFKCLITGEGTGRILAGDRLDVLSLTLPHAEKLVAERLNPLARAGRKLAEAQGQVDQLARLPADLRGLVRLLARGDAQVTIVHTGLDRNFGRIERALNRLGLSVLLGCVAVAAALLLRSGGAAVEQVFIANRVLGLTLLTATLAVALWLLFRTLRRS